MSLPSGVVVGQGVGVPTEFSVKSGLLQRSYSSMKSAAVRGTCVKHTAVTGEVDTAGAGITVVAGILGQDVYDPTGLPAQIAQNIFADGILTYSQTGQPVSVWKLGEFYLTNVSGSVAYGDFLAPAAGGAWASSGATNNLKNGSVVCVVPNSAADGPIQVVANLA
jgi:hypothetical protein